MATTILKTPRLDLILQTPSEVLMWVESLPPADRAEVSPVWIDQVRATKEGDHWSLVFRVVERASQRAVGSCSFKGPPDASGMVELAYGIDAAYQGRGFATEAAAALTEFALQSGEVQKVRAHTKRENLASERVLQKCGFRRLGEVFEPDDGLVWRWERVAASPGQ